MSRAIRAMTVDDVDAVYSIERVTFPTPWPRRTFVTELTTAAGRSWIVLERDGEILGYGGVALVEDEAHLMNLAVRADVRRAGLGSALLAELVDRARAAGAERLTLEVRERNRAAIALYEAAGLEGVGVRPGYYGDTGEGALIMWSEDLASPAAEEALSILRTRGCRALADLGHGEMTESIHAGGEIVLGVETSCDETAAAVLRGGTEVLSSVVASQVDFHARFGGVVPEIASRKHTEAIVGVVTEALERAGVRFCDLDCIAVTHGPGLVGALVVGLAYAKGASFATGIPLVGVNHLEGHIFAAALEDPALSPPLVALVVSGGHTSLVYVPEWGVYKTLGETLDDATGEAFDKVAKVLGLGYPGGPAISRLAESGDPEAVRFPRAMLNSGDYSFSLSGLKTAVVNHVRHERQAGREIDVAGVAASFQQAVIDVQVAKALRAVEEYGVDALCMAGGVAANPALREILGRELQTRGIRFSVPELALCTDNAVMIAKAGTFRFRSGERLGLDADARPDLRLG